MINRNRFTTSIVVLLVSVVISYIYFNSFDAADDDGFTCQQAMKHLPHIAIPRPSGSSGSLKVAQYIQSQFSSKYWDFEEDVHEVRDTPLGPITYRNLIFTHRGVVVVLLIPVQYF